MTMRTPPVVQCQHCQGEYGHPPIEGDGPPVCYPCIVRLGRYANEAQAIRDLLDSARISRRLASLGSNDEDCEGVA